MSKKMSVSGNNPVEEPTPPETVETPETEEPPKAEEPETEEHTAEEPETEITTPTQITNYSVDNSEVCNLLTQLIAEVQKTNETNNKIYETMLLHHEEYIQNYKDSMEFFEKETIVEEETEEPETETMSHEDIVEEQLLLIGENLDKLNVTVSGNAVILEEINATVSGNATTFGDFTESYAEHAESTKETNTYNIAIGIGLFFAVAIIIGLIISKTSWGRMK